MDLELAPGSCGYIANVLRMYFESTANAPLLYTKCTAALYKRSGSPQTIFRQGMLGWERMSKSDAMVIAVVRIVAKSNKKKPTAFGMPMYMVW